MTTTEKLQEQFYSCMPLFIALGDKVRLSIIQMLSEEAMKKASPGSPVDFKRHAMNVTEITRRTHLSRPAISHHLKILKDAGLIDLRQDGTANYYYLTLKDSTKTLMELGYQLQEFMY